MSVQIVNSYKCSDNSLFLDKKEADEHETLVNLKAWLEEFGKDGLASLSDMVDARDSLRHALNGVYLGNKLIKENEPVAVQLPVFREEGL